MNCQQQNENPSHHGMLAGIFWGYILDHGSRAISVG
jgi:hypothetical protein